MQENKNISCPNCGESIDVNKILYDKLEDELRRKNYQEQNRIKKEYEKAFDYLKQEEEKIKKDKEKLEESVKLAIKERLKEEKKYLENSLRKEIFEEQNEVVVLLQKQLEEKSNQVKELNKSKIIIEQLKREKEEIETKVQAEAELKISEKLKVEKEKIKKLVDEENELKFKQKDEHLKQLQEQLQIAQRKAEQGSMQLQGEVQELAIEEYLKNKYPFDNINEVKKGLRGADCIQIVNTRATNNCGKIYYESKRTKEFSKTWIEKFKIDMRDISADIGVLVTQTMPKDMDRVGLLDGIWVCTFEEFKGLSEVLRENIIRLHSIKNQEENRTDKMNLLYNYLTSNEFAMQVEGIVEGFSQMQNDLETEKRSMNRIWKQREKQIQKVLDNTILMYGSVKGIAGNAIADVKSLELPYS